MNSNVSDIYIKAVKNYYSGCTSVVKQGNMVSPEFPVTKGLRQGCAMAPTPFKIYIERALASSRTKCLGLGVPIDNDILYTLLFTNDQVIITGEKNNAIYMLIKLKVEFDKWGLNYQF